MGFNIRLKTETMGKLQSIVESRNVAAPVLNQMESDMQRFVPYDQGNLTRDTLIDTQHRQIVYQMPYAKAQFYGIVGGKYPVVNYTTDTHPQATKRWDLKTKAIYGKDWSSVAAKATLKELKNSGS